MLGMCRIIHMLYVLIATKNAFAKKMPASFEDPTPDCKSASCCEFSSNKYRHPNRNCYTGRGHHYAGTVNTSKDGRKCMNWKEHGGRFYTDKRRRIYGIGNHNFCRNPDEEDVGGPWCYVARGSFSRCAVAACQEMEYDPLNLLAVQSCETEEPKFIKPDVMFVLQGRVHYIAHTPRGYVEYKYSDVNFTSLGEPSQRLINESWNLCASEKNSDIMTFASSFDDVYVYVYFQRPNSMIKVHLTSEPSWTAVDRTVFEQCTGKAMEKSMQPDKQLTASVKQIFSMREPKSVFLLASNELIRCEWDNGILKYINTTASPFGTCPKGNLHFIDWQNRTFQLIHSPVKNDVISSANGVITSAVAAVDDKPALAYPLLDYAILNDRNLVRLVHHGSAGSMDNTCSVDGKRSRIFQIFDGHQLDDIIRWLRVSTLQSGSSWLRIHKINIRKSSYCVGVENVSCCNDIRRQVVAFPPHEGEENGGRTCFRECALRFVDVERTCPIASCGPRLVEESKHVAVVCEIPLADDPPCSIAVDDIWHQKADTIMYNTADEAVHMMETIAAAIVYQNMNDSKVLTTLVDSVQALENVNYSILSSEGAENLIADVISVFDNIVDEKRANAWRALQESYAEIIPDVVTQGMVTTGIPFNITQSPMKAKKSLSPTNMLFTMEAVLQGISSGSKFRDDLLVAKNMTLSVETENVISVIRSVGKQGVENGLDDIFLTFEPNDRSDSEEPDVTIVSKFPKLISLLKEVEEGKTGGTESVCLDGSCKDGKSLEYISHSPVISATMLRSGRKIETGVTFVIPYKDDDIPDPHKRKTKFYFSCRFLSDHQDSEYVGSRWNESGCEVTDVDYIEKLVYCTCNHTTNFAILLQVVPPKIRKEDMYYLQIISYIGESVSVFCLLITLTTFIVFRQSLKSARMVAHFHLVLALLVFHITQLFVVFAEKEKSSNPAACIVVTALTHFSLLASFCWMLCEGILLHMSVISVFNPMTYMKVLRYLLGWGIPAMVSGGTVIYGLLRKPYPTSYLEGVKSLSRSDAKPDVQLVEWCWLSSSNYLVWTMAGPAILAIMINTVILTRVSWVIARTTKATNMFRPTSEQKKDKKHIRKCLKGATILMPILGIPWVFGFIPQVSSHVGLLYAFTILNSVQGFFIMLFYCVLSAEVKTAFFKCLRKQHMLYSHNWSSQNSGRNFSNDFRTSRHRSETTDWKSRKYSAQQSASELTGRDKDFGHKRGRILSTDTEPETYKRDDVFEKCCNNNNTRLLWYNTKDETGI